MLFLEKQSRPFRCDSGDAPYVQNDVWVVVWTPDYKSLHRPHALCAWHHDTGVTCDVTTKQASNHLAVYIIVMIRCTCVRYLMLWFVVCLQVPCAGRDVPELDRFGWVVRTYCIVASASSDSFQRKKSFCEGKVSTLLYDPARTMRSLPLLFDFNSNSDASWASLWVHSFQSRPWETTSVHLFSPKCFIPSDFLCLDCEFLGCAVCVYERGDIMQCTVLCPSGFKGTEHHVTYTSSVYALVTQFS